MIYEFETSFAASLSALIQKKKKVLINSPNEVSKHALVPQYFCPETGDLGEVSVDFEFFNA